MVFGDGVGSRAGRGVRFVRYALHARTRRAQSKRRVPRCLAEKNHQCRWFQGAGRGVCSGFNNAKGRDFRGNSRLEKRVLRVEPFFDKIPRLVKGEMPYV